MSADSWFRRYWFLAFALPFFRLRHVFATPSDRLRDRSGKVPGLSNLRSDSPLDSAYVARSYLDSVGASHGSSRSGSLSVSYVVLAMGVLGLLFDTDASAQAPVQDRLVQCRPERWDNRRSDNQTSTNVGPQLSHNRANPVCLPKSRLFRGAVRRFQSASDGSHNQKP